MVNKMSLHAKIVYDADELNKLTMKELAIQVIARQDLFFPARETTLKYEKARAAALEEMQQIYNDVIKIGIPELEVGIAGIIAKYFGGDE